MRRQLTALAAVGAIAVAVLGLPACGGEDDGETEPAAGTSAVPFDRAFIDAVVPHHESAIEMAKAAKDAGLSQPELIEIANNIIVTQQLEINEMLDWREEWYGSREVDPAGAEALGLSEAEMGMEHTAADVRAADDVDQAFAEMMMAHHEGAITMAELALDHGEHEEIKQLAQQMIDAQSRENRILAEHAEAQH